MFKKIATLISLLSLLLVALPASAETIFAISNARTLVSFDSATPGTLTSSKLVTGMQPGETLVGIDFRPATGQLYAIGSTSRLYTINTATGAATLVGTGPLSPLLDAGDNGFGFNPVADRIRIVNGTTGQNLRVNPDTGMVTVDTPVAFAAGDVHAGGGPRVKAVAYTNDFAGSTTTTLYGIETRFNSLVTQGSIGSAPISPNTGQLFTVGQLGKGTGLTGFDISPCGGNTAYAALATGTATVSQLATINLATGAATVVGTIGVAGRPRSLAVAPAGVFQFSMPAFEVTENGVNATIMVSRIGGSSGAASVNYSTSNGTALSPSDYTTTSGTLNFADGEIKKSFTIPITNNTAFENDETVILTLSDPSDCTRLGAQSTAVLTIKDNDPRPDPRTQGFWKNHASAWPVTSLILGDETYTQTELLNLFNTPVGGDASLNLAHQLIAAKLNIAAGTDPSIQPAIDHADSLLSPFSGRLPYGVKSPSAIRTDMVNTAAMLDTYNNL